MAVLHSWYGGGGFIPARMLRTEVKKPILAISLELYDDATKTANETVLRKQWFTEEPGTFGALVRGKRVLIVDEVDDTRVTPPSSASAAPLTAGPASWMNFLSSADTPMISKDFSTFS